MVIRIIAQLLFHGRLELQDLLSNSEVAFLAAVIAAETLGQVLNRETLSFPHYLIVTRVILVLMLMFSAVIAGVVAPCEITSASNTTMNPFFLQTPEGHKLLTQINLVLLTCVLCITLATRLLQSVVEQPHSPIDATLQNESQ